MVLRIAMLDEEHVKRVKSSISSLRLHAFEPFEVQAVHHTGHCILRSRRGVHGRIPAAVIFAWPPAGLRAANVLQLVANIGHEAVDYLLRCVIRLVRSLVRCPTECGQPLGRMPRNQVRHGKSGGRTTNQPPFGQAVERGSEKAPAQLAVFGSKRETQRDRQHGSGREWMHEERSGGLRREGRVLPPACCRAAFPRVGRRRLGPSLDTRYAFARLPAPPLGRLESLVDEQGVSALFKQSVLRGC